MAGNGPPDCEWSGAGWSNHAAPCCSTTTPFRGLGGGAEQREPLLHLVVKSGARDPAAAGWAGIGERFHGTAIASLPDHHERKTAVKNLLAHAMRCDGATEEAIEQTMRLVSAWK